MCKAGHIHVIFVSFVSQSKTGRENFAYYIERADDAREKKAAEP